MRVPDSDLVKRVIYHILKDRGIVRTQEGLAKLVETELKKLDNTFEITPQRARKIALEIAGLEIDVRKKRGSGNLPEYCPVCSGNMEEVKSNNLLGENVMIGRRCTGCKTVFDIRTFKPSKYEFKLLKH